MPCSYAELHCLSNFSFLRGASHPDELVAQAHALGYNALALTDECSVAGVVRAHQAAKECGLKLIIGSEFTLEDGTRLVLLALDFSGYANLSQLITRGRRQAEKGSYRLTREDVACFSGQCAALWLPAFDASDPAMDVDLGMWFATTFPERAWIAVELHREGRDAEKCVFLETLSTRCSLPLVAAGDVHMHVRERQPLQDTVTAIRLCTTLADAGFALFQNGERHLRSRERLAKVYRREWLDESVRIADRCRFSLDELRYHYPEDDVPPGESPAAYLRRLTEEGMRLRWPEGVPPKAVALVEHELKIIGELHYEPYFLTVHDIVRFARSRGILCQGRGSAANSAVCYCLGITSVDPSRMEMLFERFVSKERDEPPDIDVDFEHERREEVMQYIYQRYGRDRAAIAATVITYRRRSAVRDVGRALGFSQAQIDALASNLAWWDKGLPEEQLRESGLDTNSRPVRLLLHLVRDLLGFPRHLSQHVGGFVISKGPLSHLVPIENASMPDRTVIQWDKDDLDAVGLMKVDVLALGMLSAIRRTFDLLAQHRGRQLTLATIPAEDPATYVMIQKADTVGVFQIESRAQMSMLPRLKPKNFYDLVIEVAIVRPGPIQGEMVHPYLQRRQDPSLVEYPSKAVEEVLKRTLGVPIFQEQVIKLAMVAAGFSAGEAEQLRRAIGTWKKRGTLETFGQKLIDGMRERGYRAEFAQRIYQQILGFGEYGFPESHAASFALLAYASAWLKRHEPAAFSAALLNSQPMGFYAPAQLVSDARRHGVQVRPVDVMVSAWDCTLEPIEGASSADSDAMPSLTAHEQATACDAYPLSPRMTSRCGYDNAGSNADQPRSPDGVERTLMRSANAAGELSLRLGLRMVKGFSEAAAERVVTARAQRPFFAVEDLALRASLDRRELDALAAAGALASLAGHRHQARWAVLGSEPPLPLFADAEGDDPAPRLRAPSEGEDVVADYAHLGLTLGRHPLALLSPQLKRLRSLTFSALPNVKPKRRVAVVGLVITRQHPGTANGTVFLTLEDETGIANVIVWPGLVERFRREVVAGRLLRILGHVEREGEVIHVIAQRIEDHTPLLGRLETYSRDFH